MGKCGNRELWKWRTGAMGTEVLGNSGDDEMRQCGYGKMWNCANRSMGEWGSGKMGRGANEQMEHGEMGNCGTGKRQGGKVE